MVYSGGPRLGLLGRLGCVQSLRSFHLASGELLMASLAFHLASGGLPCFPGCSAVTNLPASAGDVGLVPELGRSPGGGNGNPLQYSCLGNPMDRGARWTTGCKEEDSTW